MPDRSETERVRTMIRTAIATAALLVLPGVASASDDSAAVVAEFYEAVRTADADKLGNVLADDAVIRLGDLGFDMTGEEFIESMAEWETVAKDMTMRVKPDPDATDTDETVIRLVCYEFPSNTSMTRETTTVVDGKITANMQDEIAESCEGF